MLKTILITGSTDGIGYETAKKLLEQGHRVLLHGRTPQKLEKTVSELSPLGYIESYVADLSDMDTVRNLANDVSNTHQKLDVLINNAGVLKASKTITDGGLDVRFAVNTIAPYLLTQALLPVLGSGSRVVNLSSAAQAPVDPEALAGRQTGLKFMDAYSQSKLAIIMWSYAMAEERSADEPMIVAVNPGSLLASKMVKEAFGVAGKDLSIAADILVRAALSDEFADANGTYFDNDSGQFADPHPDALDKQKCHNIINDIENILGVCNY